MHGVYFIAEQQYHFSFLTNSALGVLMGVVYVTSAFHVGNAVRAAQRRHTLFTPLFIARSVMLLQSLTCFIPAFWRDPAAIWVFAILYMIGSALTWPLAESYLSGGRRAADLRRAVGAFNLVWCSAVTIAFWVMALVIEDTPGAIIAALGVMHILAVITTKGWPASPSPAKKERHTPAPKHYNDLLFSFRWMLVLSYILISAISPILPWRLSMLGVEISWQTVIASTWMMSRLTSVLLFERWDGWRGSWFAPAFAGAALIVGFVMAIAMPNLAGLIVGFALFGVGAGGVYAGALYYAMEVAHSELDAGGAHEATIGVGYAVGPATSLAGASLVAFGVIPETAANVVILALLAIVAGAILVAAVITHRRHRSQ